uniref:winged helix-turn-helix domain-containing protein n=1 Tax=Pseudomonas aeruginosa TaxID=287 RepID=UPI0040542C20
MTHQERAYTAANCSNRSGARNVYVEERTVDVNIRRLRKALGEVYENLVQTVAGPAIVSPPRADPRPPPGGRSRFP